MSSIDRLANPSDVLNENSVIMRHKYKLIMKIKIDIT